MTITVAIALLLLAGLLALVSYVERLYAEMGKFLSRDFQENIDAYEQRVEPRLGVSPDRAATSMSVLSHLLTGTVALLVGLLTFRDGYSDAPEIIQAVLTIIFVVVLFGRFLPFVFFTRTAGRWLSAFTLVLRALIYLVFPITVILGFAQQVAALAEPTEAQADENYAEAVDALIEAGQEEGILQETDRELIQSVVEFGEKTVRDVMTPRPEITAVPSDTTIEEFTELLRVKPYSRVPVYEDSIDNMRGIVFAHDVLQIADTEARETRVSALLKPVNFVPETKRVSALLREMQRENVHMAIVIDEYGSVAGVVTIEDLVEEIVGEIRDEHESKADIIRESDTSYIVPGNLDVDLLAHLFGSRPDNVEAATIGGLVSECLGHIPRRGEVVEEEGLRFEVLESTDRRVERVRVSVQRSNSQNEPTPMRA